MLSPFVWYELMQGIPRVTVNTKQNRGISVKTTSNYSKARAQAPAGSKMQGLTMIELMITITIMAIVMGMAIPSFNSVIRDNRVLSGANALAGAIAQARSEAIKRSRSVTVCPSTNGTGCTGSDWTLGWIVVVEKASVGTGAAPDPDPAVGTAGVLAVGSAMKKSTSTRMLGTKDWVRFTQRGMAEEVITLQLKPDTCTSGIAFQEVAVGIAGRASVAKKSC